MEINEIIAVNLRRLREERNLSLGQLAELAGVSKVMLSQVEKGASNPTINTIWKITDALQVTYADFLECPHGNVIHVKKENIQSMDEDKYHIFSYYKRDGNRNFELYQIEMEPDCEHTSIGHLKESTEYIMMVEGEMELEVNGKTHTLCKDDGFCFDGMAPHTYRNTKAQQVKMVMIISYKS
ncbi:MAG: XRE family transcriptional regulator [Oscillospiraceae bacterium]|nr:XRE family transcriptional regulator [Oscillospiraceae bacterium]